MNEKDKTIARMSSLNNATLMATTLINNNIEDIGKPQLFNMAQEMYDWITQDTPGTQKKHIKDTPGTHNGKYIMVYVDRKKDGPDPLDFRELFEKLGFKASKTGYYWRLLESEWNNIKKAIMTDQKQNWIFKTFKIKTEKARVQE